MIASGEFITGTIIRYLAIIDYRQEVSAHHKL